MTPTDTAPGPLDVSSMSKVQKLAALLIILGPETAAHFLKQLDEAELESITSEMARITVVTQEMRAQILEAFTEVAVQAGTSVLGGRDFTRSALEKSFGQFKASDIISRVAPARTTPSAMQQIMDLEPRQIFNLLKHEQPQTIALITSYMTAEKGSRVLMHLPAEVREQVVERIASMAPTPIEVVERVVEMLNQKLSGRHTRALNQTGGLKTAADVLNSLDKSLSKALLISLEERNPELGAAIRQKMFTFEDLVQLDSSALQLVLREVEMRDLAMALKTASATLKQTLLSAISKRAAEAVNDEISFMGALRLRDIEAAQGRIIEVVRRLESEGEVELGSSGSANNEVLV